MSKQTKQLFEQLKGNEPPSFAERLQEAAGFAKDIGGRLWEGSAPMVKHGNAELAAALFNGSAYVMYMRGSEGVEQERDSAQIALERHDDGRER